MFNEPVLLVGDTGCGKTTICEAIAEGRQQQLLAVGDFLSHCLFLSHSVGRGVFLLTLSERKGAISTRRRPILLAD